ncbi:poly(ADP-ribose) glycohydrolase 1-like isoform X3 [Typha angustifolia]|uniref:poly(ADP-ribose) glycohydrolase 1-like isoform X3 n=1 Tax=Typha angustifolia TaxID=59011 RepID=UPI003C301E79
MERREDLDSILPFLPLVLRSSSLFWPPKSLESLKALSLGPDVSRVDSGEVLFDAILDLRDSIGLSSEKLAAKSADGYVLFFDELMSRMDSRVWFGEVVPTLARLLLRLPSLLEDHYKKSDKVSGKGRFGLRIMDWQEAGVVLLSQELIATLLACALFCLFPTHDRDAKHLPLINFDRLFSTIQLSAKQSQEQKIKCLVHYFERICMHIPTGSVSFERKMLSLQNSSHGISYPGPADWENSNVSLCPFKVLPLGLIEDQQHDALEVDFANEYLGGGALHWGCVQEEIRFMINPELIIGMLFMASMRQNEAIEIVGVERFSQYMGEANKAFCGFLDRSKYESVLKFSQASKASPEMVGSHRNSDDKCSSNVDLIENKKGGQSTESKESIGIATGNWGCGVFGGDPEVKSMIQWLAASQALRPFIHYYTFGEASLEGLKQVTQWILNHGWTVGELWNMLVEYSSKRLRRETNVGFLAWLLPDNRTNDVQLSNIRCLTIIFLWLVEVQCCSLGVKT